MRPHGPDQLTRQLIAKAVALLMRPDHELSNPSILDLHRKFAG